MKELEFPTQEKDTDNSNRKAPIVVTDLLTSYDTSEFCSCSQLQIAWSMHLPVKRLFSVGNSTPYDLSLGALAGKY